MHTHMHLHVHRVSFTTLKKIASIIRKSFFINALVTMYAVFSLHYISNHNYIFLICRHFKHIYNEHQEHELEYKEKIYIFYMTLDYTPVLDGLAMQF